MESTTINIYKLYELPKIINNIFEKRGNPLYTGKHSIWFVFFQIIFKNAFICLE